MKSINLRSRASFISFQLSAVLVLVSLLSIVSFGQRRIADSSLLKNDLVPDSTGHLVVFDHANVTCADLNASTDPEFVNIVDDDELKLDFSSPNGTFEYRTYNSGQGAVSLRGNQPTSPKTVSIASSGSSVFSFNSQVQILAINVKVGNTSYVYSYAYAGAPLTYSDTNLITGDRRGISHITFCYGVPLSPSSGPANITGRVVNAEGRGISGARLTISDPLSGASMSVRTNPFGYYTFDAMPSGQLYIVTISDKRYTFIDDTRTITLNESLSDFDFVANQ